MAAPKRPQNLVFPGRLLFTLVLMVPNASLGGFTGSELHQNRGSLLAQTMSVQWKLHTRCHITLSTF